MIYITKQMWQYDANLWNSFGKLNEPHWRCCFIDMWFLDRLEWLLRDLARALAKLLSSLRRKLSKRTQFSFFSFFAPFTQLPPSSPFRIMSIKIFSTTTLLVVSFNNNNRIFLSYNHCTNHILSLLKYVYYHSDTLK